MKYLIGLFVVLLSGCTSVQPLPVDAVSVTQGGATLKTAFGATVTGRDWNAQPSESKGKDDSPGAK